MQAFTFYSCLLSLFIYLYLLYLFYLLIEKLPWGVNFLITSAFYFGFSFRNVPIILWLSDDVNFKVLAVV